MRLILLLLSTALCAVVGRVEAVDFKTRTVSSSKQFIVFCDDATLRGRVCSFGEEVKSEVLQILGETDHWKLPILITLAPASSAAASPVNLKLIETPEGVTVQMDVQIGTDPAAVNLQKHIVRAVLLEFTYRKEGAIKAGQRYLEPPWWLVEGMVVMIRQREFGIDTGFYRAVLENQRVPAIDQLLASDAGLLGSATAQAVDASYAMCLLQLLTEQPGGRQNLVRLIQHWPERGGDPVAALIKDFPVFATSPNALQKWWTLNVARLSVLDRHRGLTMEDTDPELGALLSFEMVVDKAGTRKTFLLNDFEEFTKLPASKAVMTSAQAAIVALSARANVIFRPVLADYEKIFAALARGKTRAVSQRIAAVEAYRKVVLHRADAIADYLNFYEATQLGSKSHAFDSFMKAANEIAAQEARTVRDDPIARYLDELQQEF